MGEYLFRFPRNMPLMDFESLRQWLGDRHERKIGTTVTIQHLGDGTGADAMLVYLYDFLIAILYEPALGAVWFLPDGDEGHAATTNWVAVIARHNGIASATGRRRRRKADGPGVPVARGEAGVLVFWGCWSGPLENRVREERLVAGQQYPANMDDRDNFLLPWEHEKEEAQHEQ